MKEFTSDDIVKRGDSIYKNIYCETSDLVMSELEFHKRGLSYTASGYGKKIPSPYMISFNGKLYRLYVTVYSNVGSTWFECKEHGRIYVS